MATTEFDRVRRNTSELRNRLIDEKTVYNIKRYYEKGPEAIVKRIKKLEREWDIERILELNAATITLLGVLFGVKDRRWLILSGLVTLFLAQHALQGWCPPLPLLRAIGFRTRQEIDYEKYALKILNGDIAASAKVNDVWQMVKSN